MKGVHATSLKSGLMGVLTTETFVDKHALDENFVDLFASAAFAHPPASVRLFSSAFGILINSEVCASFLIF